MSFEQALENIWKKFVTFFKQDVAPTAHQIKEAFWSQFETEGGKILFSDVTAFVVAAESATGVGPIVAAAEAIALKFVGQALDLAGHDLMSVILNALRVHVEAAAVPASTISPNVPAASTADTQDPASTAQGDSNATA